MFRVNRLLPLKVMKHLRVKKFMIRSSKNKKSIIMRSHTNNLQRELRMFRNKWQLEWLIGTKMMMIMEMRTKKSHKILALNSQSF
jgi:hypothetical protein